MRACLTTSKQGGSRAHVQPEVATNTIAASTSQSRADADHRPADVPKLRHHQLPQLVRHQELHDHHARSLLQLPK